MLVFSHAASISADAGLHPSRCARVQGGSSCMRQPRTLGKKALKRKSALLAELLVQLVFIRKTRTSCGCHDGFFFFKLLLFWVFFSPLLGRSPESGMRGASLRTGEPRDTVSAHLRTSGRFSCWPACNTPTPTRTRSRSRTRSQTRSQAHAVRLTVTFRCGSGAGRTDALNTAHAPEM